MIHQESHISLAACDAISRAAIAYAREIDVNIVCVIVDANGRIKQLCAMDGAAVIADTMATQKAQTALLGMPNDALGEALELGSANFHSLLKQSQSNFLAGGLPIMHEGKLIGAIGVGGASTEQDLACAQHALNALG